MVFLVDHSLSHLSRQPQFLFIYLFSFIPGFGNLRENLNFDSNVFSVFKIKKK